MNALTLVFVALCVFTIGYRFYGLFIAKKVLELKGRKADSGRQNGRRSRLCQDQ